MLKVRKSVFKTVQYLLCFQKIEFYGLFIQVPPSSDNRGSTVCRLNASKYKIRSWQSESTEHLAQL